MKIQLGNIVINKTKKYLAPCLKAYGNDFEGWIQTVFKLGIGIGDIVTIRSNIKLEKHLFILIDTNVYPENFERFQLWIRGQEMYEDDYAYDNILKGHLHMVVVKLPEEFYDTHETFKKSQYSKMYNQDQLKKLFRDKPDVKKILVKDHSYKMEFAKQIKDMYDVELKPEEIDDKFEFDFPINDDELFNEHLSK